MASDDKGSAMAVGRPTMAARLGRMIPYAIILAAACALLYQTGKFDYDKLAAGIGPDAWPRLILSLMVAACVYEIVRLAVFWRGEVTSSDIDSQAEIDLAMPDDGAPPAIPRNLLTATMALGVIVAYLLSLPYLGFFLATFLFVGTFALIAGYRRIGIVVSVALGLTLLFMIMFMRVIYVSLPIGVEPFSRVSLWLMKILGIS
jgi:putative tricarboxylic transport membrane protein